MNKIKYYFILLPHWPTQQDDFTSTLQQCTAREQPLSAADLNQRQSGSWPGITFFTGICISLIDHFAVSILGDLADVSKNTTLVTTQITHSLYIQ